MENTRRYILALYTFFTFIYSSAGENFIKEQVLLRKLRAPVIYKLHPSGYSGTVRITCIATGKPRPQVTWTVNDTLIQKNKHYDFKYDNQSMLVIRDTTYKDSGRYKCTASNRFGKIFQELNLRIKGVGKFEPPFRQGDECQYRNVTVGRSFELACPPHTNAYGQEYKWVVNPLDIWKPGYPIDRLFQAANGSLIFSYVKKSDIKLIDRKGGLSCGLVIEFKIVPSVSIKLFDDGNEYTGTTKPTISVFMDKSSAAVVGTGVKLLCGATGKPNPELRWFKDNRIIYSPLDGMLERDAVVEGKGMVIQFRSVKASHAGTYKCIARNAAGEDARESTLVVNSHARWKTRLVLHRNLKVKESVKLQCIAEGKPKPTYTWMHNETLIKTTPSRKIKGGSLEIPVAEFTDAGFYLCIAENKVNKIVTASYVNVMAFAPSIVTPFKEINYFFTGSTNTLHCNVTGGPAPAIQWYRNGIATTSETTIVFDKATNTLDGVYKCLASNIEGSANKSTVVKVFDRTIITKGPADFTFELGSVANLFCEAKYDETIKVTFEWLKNGKILTYDNRVNLKKGIMWKTRGLQINGLMESDAGIYTCRVFTKDDKSFRSQDEKAGSITILGAPGKPKDVKLIGDCSNDEVNLTWSAPTKFIGRPVGHYVIEYFDVNDASKSYTYKTPNEITATSYIIKTSDLPALSTIRFRVKSVSGERSSSASEGTQVNGCTVPSGVPFAAPMGLKVTIDDDGNLTVSWDKFPEIFKTGKDFEIVGSYKEIVNDKVVDTKKIKLKGDGTSFKIPVGDLNKNDAGKYEIEVWAANSQGAGPKTKKVIEHPGNLGLALPLKVGNVRVDKVTDTSVTLKWDDTASADSYMMYTYDVKSVGQRRRRRSTKERVGSKEVTGKNTGTIDGLKASKKYVVTVAARNVKGEGNESDPVEFKTAPGVPKDVKLKTYGKAIALTWKPEENDDVTGYDVTWYPSGETDPKKKKSKELGKDADKAFITSDLEPFKYYTVELNAKTDAGKGKPWKMAGVVVGKPDRPGKPKPPTVKGLNISTIDVEFNLPTKTGENSGGLPDKVHVYYVKLKEDGQPDSEEKNKTVDYPEATSTLLVDLDLAAYSVWTVGENIEGRGEASDPVTEMTVAPTTIPPPTTTAAPTTTPNITYVNVTAAASRVFLDKEFYSEIWFIILIALILLILLIALIICAVMNNGNAGRYPVGQKEKKYGGWDNNQQLQDYSDNPMDKPNGMPFNSYITFDQGNPTNHIIPRDNKMAVSDSSIAKVPILDDNDDNDSLDFYQEDNKFAEDGSFIGEYGDERQSYTNNGLL